MDGTELVDPKLRSKCAQGKVAAVHCDMINRAGADGAAPPCGQFADGAFTFSVNASLHTFKLPGSELPPQPGSTRGCHLLEFNRELEGKVLFKDRLLVTSLCSTFRYFTSSEALAILVAAAGNRGILFSGDSMMRQLFLRVIGLLRGENVVADHYFHTDAVYVLWGNATDQLHVLTPRARATLAPLLASHYTQRSTPNDTPAANPEVVLTMMFQWETKPREHRTDFLSIDPPLHVAAFMYWWGNREPLTDLDPYIERVNRRGEELQMTLGHAADGAGRRHRRRFVYVTTPWTAPRTFGGIEDEIRLARNRRAADWVLNSPRQGALEMLLLDFAGIAASRPFPKTKDGIHYMCIWKPKFPERSNSQKYNGLQCEDPMNLGLAQWLLHLLHSSLSQ